MSDASLPPPHKSAKAHEKWWQRESAEEAILRHRAKVKSILEEAIKNGTATDSLCQHCQEFMERSELWLKMAREKAATATFTFLMFFIIALTPFGIAETIRLFNQFLDTGVLP